MVVWFCGWDEVKSNQCKKIIWFYQTIIWCYNFSLSGPYDSRDRIAEKVMKRQRMKNDRNPSINPYGLENVMTGIDVEDPKTKITVLAIKDIWFSVWLLSGEEKIA